MAMIRSVCLRQAQLASLRSPISLRTAKCLTSGAPASIRPLEISSWLVRRASTKPPPKSKSTPKSTPPKSKSMPKASSDKKQEVPKASRVLIWHAGLPRILSLGFLKLSTILVFGFFTAVTIPSNLQADAPVWQTAGLVVASVIPALAIWYLTSPMVMWIHVKIPKRFKTNPAEARKFFETIPASTEIVVTTMGPMGNARRSKMTLAELQPAKRRLGLVNYVRDVTRENAQRKWYQFWAVREFKIDDRGFMDPIKGEQTWNVIQRGLRSRNQQAGNVSSKQKIRHRQGGKK